MRKWALFMLGLVFLPIVCSAASEPPEFNVRSNIQSSDSSLQNRFESCVLRNLKSLANVRKADAPPKAGFAFELYVLVMADKSESGESRGYVASWVGLQKALPLVMATNAIKPFQDLDEEIPKIIETLESISQRQTFYTNWSSGMGNGSDSEIEEGCKTLVAGFDERLLQPVRDHLKNVVGDS